MFSKSVLRMMRNRRNLVAARIWRIKSGLAGAHSAWTFFIARYLHTAPHLRVKTGRLSAHGRESRPPTPGRSSLRRKSSCRTLAEINFIRKKAFHNTNGRGGFMAASAFVLQHALGSASLLSAAKTGRHGKTDLGLPTASVSRKHWRRFQNDVRQSLRMGDVKARKKL